MFDLNQPNSEPQAWSSGTIDISADYMHNFIWLHYEKKDGETTGECLLLHNKNEHSIGCYLIKKDQEAQDLFTHEIRKPNLLLRESSTLFLACSTDAKNFPL